MREIALIGAPTSAGAYAPGQELAPAALRAAGLAETLSGQGMEVRDLGDGPFQRWRPDRDSPRAQNADLVVKAIDAATQTVQQALADGDFALVLGGDCTVGLAAIRALAASDVPFGLCYLDLNADMNTPTSTVDGALDWMGLGCALGIEGSQPGICPPGLLTSERVVLIGFDETRATAWERTQIDRLGIGVVPVRATASEPENAARTAIGALPADVNAIAVHFDVDVIDFTDAPLSEETNRNLGLSLQSAIACLATLLADRRVRVLTITELNPLHGAADGSTLRRFVDGVADALAAALTERTSVRTATPQSRSS